MTGHLLAPRDAAHPVCFPNPAKCLPRGDEADRRLGLSSVACLSLLSRGWSCATALSPPQNCAAACQRGILTRAFLRGRFLYPLSQPQSVRVSVCLPGPAPTCDYGLCDASYSFERETVIDGVREAKARRDRSTSTVDWPGASPNLPAGMGLGQRQPLSSSSYAVLP